MKLFDEIVAAVEENNRINEGQWKNWESISHICEIYNIAREKRSEYYGTCALFINSLCRDNGENLHVYRDAMDCLEYGQCFSGQNERLEWQLNDEMSGIVDEVVC